MFVDFLLPCKHALVAARSHLTNGSIARRERKIKRDMTNVDLITALVSRGALRSPRCTAAFHVADRSMFVPTSERERAYDDVPLTLGYGSTISQPTTVAIMLELLQPQTGEQCLDVGAGSGWTAALLSTLVGPDGHVIAVERVPQVAAPAATRLRQAGYANVTYHVGDAGRGWASRGSYDVIHIAAAADHVPPLLVDQLAVGGRLVMPVGRFVQDLVLLTKIGENRTTERRIPGFQFVPLITHEHHSR